MFLLLPTIISIITIIIMHVQSGAEKGWFSHVRLGHNNMRVCCIMYKRVQCAHTHNNIYYYNNIRYLCRYFVYVLVRNKIASKYKMRLLGLADRWRQRRGHDSVQRGSGWSVLDCVAGQFKFECHPSRVVRSSRRLYVAIFAECMCVCILLFIIPSAHYYS